MSGTTDTTDTSITSLLGLDPASYRPHALHSTDRTYAETNCYADVLIELLHARGNEPLAAMGSTLRVDFEGDQWTFFKPYPEDLAQLFGLDIHEMQPYRPLPLQIDEQIRQGRTLIVELDSWYLPDTSATSYRSEHVKTSVVAEAIALEGERLHYFHATGLHELHGEDYRGVFRLGKELSADVLPPYTELVRFDAGAALSGEQLRAASLALTSGHLAHRPASNPFVRFGEQLQRDLPHLLEGDAHDYHDYAFATVRMAGSAFEVAASHLQWLLGDAGHTACDALGEIVQGCKALSFRLARRRPFDPTPTIEALSSSWQRAIDELGERLS